MGAEAFFARALLLLHNLPPLHSILESPMIDASTAGIEKLESYTVHTMLGEDAARGPAGATGGGKCEHGGTPGPRGPLEQNHATVDARVQRCADAFAERTRAGELALRRAFPHAAWRLGFASGDRAHCDDGQPLLASADGVPASGAEEGAAFFAAVVRFLESGRSSLGEKRERSDAENRLDHARLELTAIRAAPAGDEGEAKATPLLLSGRDRATGLFLLAEAGPLQIPSCLAWTPAVFGAEDAESADLGSRGTSGSVSLSILHPFGSGAREGCRSEIKIAKETHNRLSCPPLGV
jgi:hypothetical protein